jgi:HEAT repeat protein
MTRSKVICIALTCAIAGASIGLAQDKSLKETFEELLPGMSAEKIPDRKGPQQQWQEICFQAGAPSNEANRAEVCQLMAGKIGSDTAKPARIWLLTQLERIGRGECVDAVAAALDDKDPHVRDGARRALTNNPTPEANAKLVAKLQGTSDNKLKIGLLNSLGYRADDASVAAVAKELTNKDQGVAAAAARALGKIATADAAKALAAARAKAKGDARFRITDSYLLCADSLLRQGKAKEAAAIYTELNKPDEAKSVRLAAVQGLLKAAGKN